MDSQLNLGMFFRHAVRHAAEVEIVTRAADGKIRRYTYADFGRRAQQLMHGLDRLGVEPGEVVGTLAYNSDRHLESYFAIPCSGRVLHTINPRLSPEDLAYTIRQADDRVIMVDSDFLPLLARISGGLPRVRKIIVLDGAGEGSGLAETISYEELIADEADSYPLPDVNERSPLGICFTTGTTGRPKGVVYTHRSSILHAMAITSGAGIGIGPSDCACVQVPMFHANCFGMPHACAAVGAKQVFCEGPFDPASFVEILANEQVTFTAGVPTIWQMVAKQLKAHPVALPDLRFLVTAGSQPPRSLMETYRRDFGLQMVQAWGMTEGSPVISVSWPKHRMRSWDQETLMDRVGQQAGLPLALVDLSIRDEENREVPWDGTTMGQAYVRGPWIAAGYLGQERDPAKFTDDGWFATGDTVIGSPDGYVAVVDRMKDLVKSGGEWISSVDMENAIVAMPEVADAAVIAVLDEKWGERPLVCVVPAEDCELSLETVRAHLEQSNFERWQLPDRVEVMEAIPRTSVGKVNKKALRDAYALEGGK
jgi:fatty-acyl-CoA synthase